MLDLSGEFMRPVVSAWFERIAAARKAKKLFNSTADTCMQFFAGAVGWMYEDEHRKRFTKKDFSPRFRVTLNKAFELVAVVGPTLYHRNPVRTCKPYPVMQFSAEAFGDPDDPAVQLFSQQMARQESIRYEQSKARNRVYETYASYTPREQPGGGLETAATDAITEAMIKGGSVLWPSCYRSPAGDRKLTGCFYDSIDNLYVDPGANSLDAARWIAQKCQAPHWQLEREFKLPEGSLKKYAKYAPRETGVDASVSQVFDPGPNVEDSFDQVTYWKVWSKAGVHRLKNGGSQSAIVHGGLTRSFDETVGDYAYLVLVQECPYPLNAPIEAMRKADDAAIKEMFSWPVPYWADDRLLDGASIGNWPMSMLYFYRKPNDLWPIPPMAPGLGELTIMNIVMSAIVNRVWNGSKTMIGVLKSAAESVRAQIERGDDLVVVEIDQIHQSLNNVISTFSVGGDASSMWDLMDRLSSMFDKRVGLSDFLYGLNSGAVSRSAEDVAAKRDAVGVRIGDMAQSVEKWLGDAASKEKICAYWSRVSGKDVLPLVGQSGAYIWDSLFANADPDIIFREMHCTIESGTARRPNKDRDIANMNNLFPPLLSQASTYARETGDTEPINNLVQKMGEVMDQPLDGVQFGTWVPFETRMQMEQQANEQQEGGIPPEQAQAQADNEHAMEMQRQQDEHDLKMQQDAETHQQKMKIAEAQLRMQRIKATKASAA